MEVSHTFVVSGAVKHGGQGAEERRNNGEKK